jgi:2-keto-3-deoxy-L-rhamnonate aldolase RhmA
MHYIRSEALQHRFLAGTWCSLASPVSCELIGHAGYDWLLLDMEHAPSTPHSLLGQLQAVRGLPVAPIVRVPVLDGVAVKWVLDLGASGVMFPNIDTPEQAAAAVSFMRYPPAGVRGVGAAARCADYGFTFPTYFAEANRNLLTVTQIESPRAVEACGDIAAVDGVDVLFVGPMDLSTSLDLPRRFEDARFMEVLARVADTARSHGKAAGILIPDPTLTAAMRDLGFTFVAVGADCGILARQLAANLKTVRGMVA